MSPRAKRIPDADIVLAAARVVAERGAHRTRLADVAAATGLAAATLVQRFGSREALLRAIGDGFAARIIEVFAARMPSHLARIEGALEQLGAEGHLAFLLANSASAPAYSLELRKQIAFALDAAVQAGELAPCEIALHARRLQCAFYGSATAGLLENGVSAAIRPLMNEILADFL